MRATQAPAGGRDHHAGAERRLEGQVVAVVVVPGGRARGGGCAGAAVEQLEVAHDQLGLVVLAAVLLPGAGLEAALDVEQRAFLDQAVGGFGRLVKLSRLVAQPTRLQNGT